MESKQSAMESKHEMEKMRDLVHGFDVEREQLVEAAIQQFVQGEEKGELSGWDEAVCAFLKLGHITQAIADGVTCSFTMSMDDGEGDDLMETKGAGGVTGGEGTDEETALWILESICSLKCNTYIFHS